jgi:hypothetical protein
VAAVRAFDLHYGEEDAAPDMTPHAQAMLACLVQAARISDR